MEYPERKTSKREQNLENIREQAIVERDREKYIQTTLELGYDIGEVPWLAGEPEEREDLEEIILEEEKIENVPLKVDKNKEFVEIMNSKSFQNIKQSYTRRKLKKLLGSLKRKGYETNYSPNMNTTEMLGCYFKDRRDILNL